MGYFPQVAEGLFNLVAKTGFRRWIMKIEKEDEGPAGEKLVNCDPTFMDVLGHKS
jgi:hypothetical protein